MNVFDGGVLVQLYILTDFLPAVFVSYCKGLLKSPTIMVNLSFSLSILSVFASPILVCFLGTQQLYLFD